MTHVVFIDSRIADQQTLIDGLAPGSEWFLIDAAEDGVTQMAQALSGRSGIEAIHIFSHGSTGVLQLGATILDSSNLSDYASQLAAIGQALTETGDILLYGCNVASGEVGQQFITRLAQLTGSDVAASLGLTGAGGDWILEVSAGDIKVGTAIGAETLAAYTKVPGLYLGTSGADNLTGTAGNDTFTAGAGNDTLDGGAGTDTIAYAGSMAGYCFGLNASSHITITDTNITNGDQGADILANVERASFADGQISLRVYGEMRINTTTADSQFSPAITALADGGYVVTWVSNNQDGSDRGIYAQRFGANGAAVGGETRINTTTANGQYSPAITVLADGGYVVTWTSVYQDGSSDGIYAQRFDAIGSTIGGETRINATTADSQFSPAITALADGGLCRNLGVNLPGWQLRGRIRSAL